MRSAPLNYLLALGLAGVLWIVFSFVLGGYLADNVALLEATLEDFVGMYRLVLTVAAVVGLLLTYIWFYTGAQPDAARDMAKASRRWMVLLLTAFGASVVATIALVVAFSGEQFTLVQYLVFFVAASALTWLLYWISTVVWSPRAVMNTMPPRK